MKNGGINTSLNLTFYLEYKSKIANW